MLILDRKLSWKPNIVDRLRKASVIFAAAEQLLERVSELKWYFDYMKPLEKRSGEHFHGCIEC